MNPRVEFAALPRPVRSVPLPGGGSVYVRDLTIAELRAVDRAAEKLPEGERGLGWVLRLVAAALALPDGSPAFDPPADEAAGADQAAEVERYFGHAQLRVIAEAAVPSREDQKKS